MLIVAAGIKLDYDRIKGAKDALDEDCRVVSTYSPQVRDFIWNTPIVTQANIVHISVIPVVRNIRLACFQNISMSAINTIIMEWIPPDFDSAYPNTLNSV